MTVRDQNLDLICGNDYAILVSLFEGPTGSTPLDLTSAAAISYIARHQPTELGTPVITKGLGTGIAITGAPTLGQVTLSIADTDTLPLSGDRLVGEFVHEMRVEDGIGNLSSVFQGTLTVRPTAAA